ncbi:hypothetical protein GCM10011376_23870 [Nocardioides flavus (ex Wang et al. 2016)]|uniref:Alpha/beta hydrolase n=1 Tax=Nocardioides flavus (ex Wang et al. 2016) TaxID=2058780 RepID=A0ABQ3HMZ3_9ACTN|nr:alpha/beta hydrolase [Nocardioides flavus (ex Wang et al. 2016)]GHE17777.1 hypothetical protein GCM10011376_23870 [Nocardioides flavus (ex Wang et al. 2016)]
MRPCAVAVVLVVALAGLGALAAVRLVGQRSDDRADRSGSTWTPQTCPADVEVEVVPEHTCGWVSAPLGDSTQQVFVVVVEPPAPSDRSPILETGTDLGMAPDYAGLAPIAQRTGRRTVIVDLPGTGHSVPSLDCSDAESLGDAAAGSSALVEAIGTCRDRLAAEGVDPGLMTPQHSAAVLLAVMDAVGSERWVLMGHGTTGATAVEVAREHPDRVEALVLDSAVHVHDGWRARRSALLRRVASACAADVRCARRHGDVLARWREARRRAATRPVDLEGVPLDRELLDRAVRWLVAPVSSGPAQLPDLLGEAAAGRRGPVLDRFATALRLAPPLCVGVLPKCVTREQVVLGAVLSGVCPTAAGREPYVAVCARWGIGEQAADDDAVVGVPTLVLHGELDPYATAAEASAQVRRWVSGAHLVVARGRGHNVLGDQCARSVRNDWLAGPLDRAPLLPTCVDEDVDFP